jgi:hypothetical protein
MEASTILELRTPHTMHPYAWTCSTIVFLYNFYMYIYTAIVFSYDSTGNFINATTVHLDFSFIYISNPFQIYIILEVQSVITMLQNFSMHIAVLNSTNLIVYINIL